jgi:predicted amidophosphoribosyltransferase
MTTACCPDCRLRFTSNAGAYLPACPRCGEPLQTRDALGVVGFGLFTPDGTEAEPVAVAVAMPIPGLSPDWP